MKDLLVPQCDSNDKGGLHRINGLLAPQLEKVIITRGFTKLRVFSPVCFKSICDVSHLCFLCLISSHVAKIIAMMCTSFH